LRQLNDDDDEDVQDETVNFPGEQNYT